ncbi:MAG: hypothetical protein ACO3A2_09150 [Bdellovibrionia bacterium]
MKPKSSVGLFLALFLLAQGAKSDSSSVSGLVSESLSPNTPMPQAAPTDSSGGKKASSFGSGINPSLGADGEKKGSEIYRIDEVIAEARRSRYSDQLPLSLKNWPPSVIEKGFESHKPIWIKGIKTAGNSTYIGSLKQFLIQAPLHRVAAHMEDFEAYPKILRDVKKVEVVHRSGNKFTTAWERKSPVFFIPNIHYEQIYLIDRSDKRVVVRYQLKSGDSIRFADGLTVLSAEGSATRLTAYDFFDAEFGILSGIAAGKIWHDALHGVVRDDFSFKLSAEHPNWSSDRLSDEVDRLMDQYSIDPIEYLDPPAWLKSEN